MPRFTTLYSGSSGNCAVIEQDGRFVLVDMGASCRATLGALVELGLTPRNLAGILVTHEHSDHIKGLNVFLKKVKVPVFGTPGTLRELYEGDLVPSGAQLVPMKESQVELDGFGISNFGTSHDAAGCCGYRITVPGGGVVAIATDLGCMTPEVFEQLRAAQVVALEANYDPEMLRLGRYPYYLKKRISSEKGHLSNRDAAVAVARLIGEGCRRVALCHMSAENNQTQLVYTAIEDALVENGMHMPAGCVVKVARRHQVSDWIEF